MKTLQKMSRQELEELHSELAAQFEEIKAEGLKLDMSRGKPAPEQQKLRRYGWHFRGEETDSTDAGDKAGECDRRRKCQSISYV